MRQEKRMLEARAKMRRGCRRRVSCSASAVRMRAARKAARHPCTYGKRQGGSLARSVNCAIEKGCFQQGTAHLPAMKRSIVALPRAYSFMLRKARCQV
eukprot:2488731-Pyramimonas_sp.AAC.1